MANSPENTSMAVFCDFENVALGVRDANYEKFDIKPVLERLLLKGSIVVKKSYCDWDRYKSFKAAMHEANFELIEIPHVRQSGKNSADIRLVVDALDLCYTKSHVNTFVIISGDSDFSPLVSKLRENAKQVIGVGVKQSTSDLLIANCDEFIFYDDLVRETRRSAAKRERGSNDTATPQQRRTPEEEKRYRDDLDKRRTQAIDIALETFEALIAERGDSGKIWASMLKQAIKRRKPDFNENYFGFRTFGNLIEEAQSRGLLEFGRDEKSGAYVYRASAERASSNGMDAPEHVKSEESAAPAVSSDMAVPEAMAPRPEAVASGASESSESSGASGMSGASQPISEGGVRDPRVPASAEEPAVTEGAGSAPRRPARKPARLSARAAKIAREKSAQDKAAFQVAAVQEATVGRASHEGASAAPEITTELATAAIITTTPATALIAVTAVEPVQDGVQSLKAGNKRRDGKAGNVGKAGKVSQAGKAEKAEKAEKAGKSDQAPDAGRVGKPLSGDANPKTEVANARAPVRKTPRRTRKDAPGDVERKTSHEESQ